MRRFALLLALALAACGGPGDATPAPSGSPAPADLALPSVVADFPLPVGAVVGLTTAGLPLRASAQIELPVKRVEDFYAALPADGRWTFAPQADGGGIATTTFWVSDRSGAAAPGLLRLIALTTERTRIDLALAAGTATGGEPAPSPTPAPSLTVALPAELLLTGGRFIAESATATAATARFEVPGTPFDAAAALYDAIAGAGRPAESFLLLEPERAVVVFEGGEALLVAATGGDHQMAGASSQLTVTVRTAPLDAPTKTAPAQLAGLPLPKKSSVVSVEQRSMVVAVTYSLPFSMAAATTFYEKLSSDLVGFGGWSATPVDGSPSAARYLLAEGASGARGLMRLTKKSAKVTLLRIYLLP
jgi:hypothetical protein